MTMIPPPIEPDSDLSRIPILNTGKWRGASGEDRYQSGVLRACLFLGGAILLILLLLSSCTPVRPPHTEAEKVEWCSRVPEMRRHVEKYAGDDIEAEGLELQIREYEEIGQCGLTQ